MAESLNPTVFHRRMNRLMAHWKVGNANAGTERRLGVPLTGAAKSVVAAALMAAVR